MIDGKRKFYPIEHRYKEFLNEENYWFCPDLDSFAFFGNYQTPRYNTLKIDFLIKEEFCNYDDYSDCNVSIEDELVFEEFEVMALANEGRYI